MTDANPYGGFNMGESWEDGIVGGARWIKEKYYDEGYTTLNGMIHGGKRYSSSGDAWIDAICSNMNKCYRVLRKYERG
jgi:beta-N-acetylglucosaminidase